MRDRRNLRIDMSPGFDQPFVRGSPGTMANPTPSLFPDDLRPIKRSISICPRSISIEEHLRRPQHYDGVIFQHQRRPSLHSPSHTPSHHSQKFFPMFGPSRSRLPGSSCLSSLRLHVYKYLEFPNLNRVTIPPCGHVVDVYFSTFLVPYF